MTAVKHITFYTPGFRHYKTGETFNQNPSEYVSISVTGQGCILQCGHCQGKMLKGMINLPRYRQQAKLDSMPIEESLISLCQELSAHGTRGILISGGCDASGQVPLGLYLDAIPVIHQRFGLNVRVHTGLASESLCEKIAAAAVDGAVLDILGDQETITQVFHLNATPKDYAQALAYLGKYGVPAIPHVILGLKGHVFTGEYAAVEMIARHPHQTVVIVILNPLRGTALEGMESPSLSQIQEFFHFSRQRLPDSEIVLGCARPLNNLRIEIEKTALLEGFNGIAFPADGVVAFAANKGLDVRIESRCCGH